MSSLHAKLERQCNDLQGAGRLADVGFRGKKTPAASIIAASDKVQRHGLYRANGKEMETTVVYWGYIGILEKTMETIIVSWGGVLYRNDGKEYGN